MMNSKMKKNVLNVLTTLQERGQMKIFTFVQKVGKFYYFRTIFRKTVIGTNSVKKYKALKRGHI